MTLPDLDIMFRPFDFIALRHLHYFALQSFHLSVIGEGYS